MITAVPAKLGDLVIYRRRRGEVYIGEVWEMAGRTPSVIGWADTFTADSTSRNSVLLVREGLDADAGKLIGRRFGSVAKAVAAAGEHCPDSKMFALAALKRKREHRKQ